MDKIEFCPAEGGTLKKALALPWLSLSANLARFNIGLRQTDALSAVAGASFALPVPALAFHLKTLVEVKGLYLSQPAFVASPSVTSEPEGVKCMDSPPLE